MAAGSGNWFVALAVPTSPWWERVTPPPDDVRLFAPEDVHITVAFLGPCGERAAEAAFELAPRWPISRIDITLGRVEPLGNARRPSALSAIVDEGFDELGRAILAVREPMCERAGARADERPPRPHATIARPRRRASSAQTRAAAAWGRSLDLGQPRITLRRLVLYTRADDRTGRLFREHAWHEP